MTTAGLLAAVDSSILLDVLTDNPDHRLHRARSNGALVACPAVWAEACAFFNQIEQSRQVFERAGIAFDPFDRSCAEMAGAYRLDYWRRGRIAHAEVRGARLLTRDREFFRRYSSNVEIAASK